MNEGLYEDISVSGRFKDNAIDPISYSLFLIENNVLL